MLKNKGKVILKNMSPEDQQKIAHAFFEGKPIEYYSEGVDRWMKSSGTHLSTTFSYRLPEVKPQFDGWDYVNKKYNYITKDEHNNINLHISEPFFKSNTGCWFSDNEKLNTKIVVGHNLDEVEAERAVLKRPS